MVENLNLLHNKDFKMEITRLPKVKYFSQHVELPSISVGTAILATPFTDIRLNGDKPTFELLNLDFLVDEDLNNWEEIFKWIVEYATPESFGSYTNASLTRSQLHQSKYSDATIFTMTSKYNGNIKFVFKNLFPIALSALPLTADVDDVNPIVCTATFAYETYSIAR